MKKCEKCGLSFSDDVNFCPKCGEKLVEEKATCPSCGAPIEEGALFCTQCGAKLGEEPKEEAKPVEEVPKEETPKNNKAIKVVNIVTSAISLLALLFCLIGVFGPILNVVGDTSIGSSATMDMHYFFETYPKALEQLSQYPRQTYYSYSMSMYIFEMVLYIGGMIGCFVVSIIATVNTIVALTKQEEPKLKLAFSAGTSMLPIILFAMARYSASVSAGATSGYTELGWGAGLIVASLFLIFSCMAVKKIVTSITNKSNVVPSILRTVAGLILLILLFNVFGPLSSAKVNYGYTSYTISTNGYIFGELALNAYSSSTSATLDSDLLNTGMFSLLFTLVGMVMLINGFKKVMDDSKAAPIVFTSLSFIFLIVAAALSTSALERGINSNMFEYSFASGPIAGIVLMLVMVLPAVIIANVFDKGEQK